MIQHQHQVVSGIDTDVIIQRFSDRTLVLVTQLGKVGNLVLSILRLHHQVALTNLMKDTGIHSSDDRPSTASTSPWTTSISTACNPTHQFARKCTVRTPADTSCSVRYPDRNTRVDFWAGICHGVRKEGSCCWASPEKARRGRRTEWEWEKCIPRNYESCAGHVETTTPWSVNVYKLAAVRCNQVYTHIIFWVETALRCRGRAAVLRAGAVFSLVSIVKAPSVVGQGGVPCEGESHGDSMLGHLWRHRAEGRYIWQTVRIVGDTE